MKKFFTKFVLFLKNDYELDSFYIGFARSIVIFIFKMLIIIIISFSFYNYFYNKITKINLFETGRIINIIDFINNKVENLDEDQKVILNKKSNELIENLCEINKDLFICNKSKK